LVRTPDAKKPTISVVETSYVRSSEVKSRWSRAQAASYIQIAKLTTNEATAGALRPKAEDTIFQKRKRSRNASARPRRGVVPRRAADQGRSTTNALHVELPLAVPTRQIAAVRGLARPAKTRHVVHDPVNL
jgi:hypothetical protein